MIVLDASAMLALLFQEVGYEQVEAVLENSVMSTVNLSEVLGRFARDGRDPVSVLAAVKNSPTDLVDFDSAHAAAAADLLPATRHAGLSLGDRACLALARTLGAPALTADRAWQALSVGVEIRLIR